MIENILVQAAKAHAFDEVECESKLKFFVKKIDGVSSRFLILMTLDLLETIDEIHIKVLGAVPEIFRHEPAFSKNCDLILIHKINALADYKKIEHYILSYEEDPYHFKKYFLYYTSVEQELLDKVNYLQCSLAILDATQFSNYKDNPLAPSLYSIAARIFIKLPFLAVPKASQEFVPLDAELEAALAEGDLANLYAKLAATVDENEAIEELVKGLLNEELENIQASDSGV